MKTRKLRTHHCGYSNIDFRSKNDFESLKTYQPWKVRTAFGTMGYSQYHLPKNEKNKVLGVSNNLNDQRAVLSDVPDPKFHRTAEFYSNNKIPIKAKTMNTNERIAQLDEHDKGKERFTGDSMMIADLTKNRKYKSKKSGISNKEKREKMLKYEMIIKDKKDKNREAFQETQLVNIQAKNTLANKIDIEKIKEIRLALRRRYASRTNFRKIFKDWDNSAFGEISLYDAHSMINRLGIPINYNETRTLIASSNQRQTENLNMEEFIHLIFSDNPSLNVNLMDLKYKDEKFFDEGEQMENFKKNMRINIQEMSKTDELNFLKDYLRTRIPTLVKTLNQEGKEGFCDFACFQDAIKKFTLPDKYTTEPIMRAVFDKYKNNEMDEKMNYKNFVDDILNYKEPNNFYDFKDKYMNLIKDKIEKNQNRMQESYKTLKEQDEEKKKLAKQIEEEIKNHKNPLEETKEIQGFNSYQPSGEFLKKSFANKDLYFKKHQEIEKSFSPHPSLMTELQAKTRFGANPLHKNTFVNIQAPENSACFINENKRFDIRCKQDVDFLTQEKERKKLRDIHKIKKLKDINEKTKQHTQMKEYLHDEKKIFSELQRTQKLYRYENINKIRNELVE